MCSRMGGFFRTELLALANLSFEGLVKWSTATTHCLAVLTYSQIIRISVGSLC